MSRLNLIDKDALMDKISVFFERNEELIDPSVMDCAEEIIEQAESVDAVEVVRCEECRYGITEHGISNGCVLCSKPYTERGNAMHRTDWFCADGERSEEP